MRRVCTRLALFGLVVGYAMLAASCGERGHRLPDTGATLEGTITYGGTKVPFAQVTAMGQNGMATGNVQPDGRYMMTNVPLGEVAIGVNPGAARGEFMSKVMAESKGKAKGTPRFVDVPAKYHEPETSGLKTTINKGANTFNIVITK
jgi:hypothetical protein